MATMQFSVPENLLREFRETFADENRSAIIVRLMKQAIDERRRGLELRKRTPSATDAQTRRPRRSGRP